MTQILVIDDEPAVAELISRVLTRAAFQVARVSSGAAALQVAVEIDPDLIILDLLLPDMRGEDVLIQLMAARPGRRVIVGSAVTRVAARVDVLTGGAADYLAKPFANSELLARVRARMRDTGSDRSESWPTPRSIGRAGLEMDYVRRRVQMADGREVGLTSKEFALLALLLRRAPAACSRTELLAGAWGTKCPAESGSNLLEVHMSRLRSKLAPTEIVTVRNVGYRLLTG